MKINPYQLDWGPIFVESYNSKTKKATVIYNFAFENSNLFGDYLAYSIGHIYWVIRNLPPKSSVNAIFDLRGRNLSQEVSENIDQEIEKYLHEYVSLNLLNVSFKK